MVSGGGVRLPAASTTRCGSRPLDLLEDFVQSSLLRAVALRTLNKGTTRPRVPSTCNMPDESPAQAAINKLLESAQRCRRIAGGITDRLTRERLLEMAKECEDKAVELRRQTCG